jgi:hypothetical protein
MANLAAQAWAWAALTPALLDPCSLVPPLGPSFPRSWGPLVCGQPWRLCRTRLPHSRLVSGSAVGSAAALMCGLNKAYREGGAWWPTRQQRPPVEPDSGAPMHADMVWLHMHLVSHACVGVQTSCLPFSEHAVCEHFSHPQPVPATTSITLTLTSTTSSCFLLNTQVLVSWPARRRCSSLPLGTGTASTVRHRWGRAVSLPPGRRLRCSGPICPAVYWLCMTSPSASHDFQWVLLSVEYLRLMDWQQHAAPALNSKLHMSQVERKWCVSHTSLPGSLG